MVASGGNHTIYVNQSAILIALALSLTGACDSSRTTIHSASGEPAVQRHVQEFSQVVQTYGWEKEAPDGSGMVIVETHARGLFATSQGWHTLWLEGTSQRRKILTLREGDPGSGPSFSFRWSRDSKAIFIWGWYSGCKCVGIPSAAEDLRLIYTVSDGQLWSVSLPARS